jgi:hypothetical protein
MNIEETKEAIRVMQAFVEGKEVTSKCAPSLADDPSWNWNNNTNVYRIKPTTTLRPWTADEVPLGAWMRNKNSPLNGRRIMIAGTCDELVRSTWLVTSEHSTDLGKTWLPCGVMEESK